LTLFLYAALGIFMFVYPLNLIQVHKYSATATGAAALPMIILMFLLSRWSGGLISTYGARIPLIAGPLIVAAGFVLFSLPGVRANYWTGFFPAFVVLGLGMAISVAPLTTVVMNSIGQERAGVASGINNAVARVAGVLAIAVFGVVLVSAFAHSLQQSINALGLTASVVQSLESKMSSLGNLEAPPGTDPQTAAAIRIAVAKAFVFGFRTVMVLCAGLALGSSAIAWRRIPSQISEQSDQ
jgi:hypothetical protein